MLWNAPDRLRVDLATMTAVADETRRHANDLAVRVGQRAVIVAPIRFTRRPRSTTDRRYWRCAGDADRARHLRVDERHAAFEPPTPRYRRTSAASEGPSALAAGRDAS